jgi:hypothetical protein
LAVLACGGESAGGETDLIQLWLDTAPRQYVAKSCSTGFTQRMCAVSAVEAGPPVSTRVQVAEGGWEDVDPASDVVGMMLSDATRAERNGCQRRVTQHETYAFPSQVYWDCGEEGWGSRLTCFAEGTLDLARCQ